MPFIDNYNWKDIEFPSHSKDWEKFEQNNKAIVLNVLFVPYNTKQIRPAYISKYNNKRDNQVILLMITDSNNNNNNNNNNSNNYNNNNNNNNNNNIIIISIILQ